MQIVRSRSQVQLSEVLDHASGARLSQLGKNVADKEQVGRLAKQIFAKNFREAKLAAMQLQFMYDQDLSVVAAAIKDAAPDYLKIFAPVSDEECRKLIGNIVLIPNDSPEELRYVAIIQNLVRESAGVQMQPISSIVQETDQRNKIGSYHRSVEDMIKRFLTSVEPYPYKNRLIRLGELWGDLDKRQKAAVTAEVERFFSSFAHTDTAHEVYELLSEWEYQGDIKTLKLFLNLHGTQIHLWALERIGALGSEESKDFLLDMLDQEIKSGHDSDVYEVAVKALRRFPVDEQMIRRLLWLRGHGHANENQALVQAVDESLEKSDSPSDWIPMLAAELFAGNHYRAHGAAVQLMKHPDRLHIARAVKSAMPEKLQRFLLSDNQNYTVILKGISLMGDRQAMRRLKLGALIGYALLEDERAILVELGKSWDRLGAKKKAAMMSVAEEIFLNSKDRESFHEAIARLSEWGYEGSVEVFTNILEKWRFDEKATAEFAWIMERLVALGKKEGKKGEKAVKLILRTPDEFDIVHYGTIARALGHFPRNRQVIKKLLWIREEAGKHKNKKVIQTVDEILMLTLDFNEPSDQKTVLVLMSFSGLVRYSERLQPIWKAYPKVRSFFEHVEREINSKPENATLRTQFENAVDNIRKDWKDLTLEQIVHEYEVMDNLLGIAHDNFPLIINAIGNLRPLRPSDFAPLFETLPYNNPLTRIMRMLGESPANVGGYADVTNFFITIDKWNGLRDLVQNLAGTYGRGSPEQIAGVLELLREEKKSLRRWTNAEWKSFQDNVQAYYRDVFEVLNPVLFKLYSDHAKDPKELEKLKKDLERELKGLYTGSFWGFSDDFMNRYGLTSDHELSLFGRVMPIRNLLTKDFAGEVQRIKQALSERGVDAWQAEVDPEFREKYYLGGTSVEIVYAGDLSLKDRKTFHENLARYAGPAQEGDVTAALRDFVVVGDEEKERILKRAVAGFVFGVQNIDPAVYAGMPKDDVETQKCLTSWQTFFHDTFEHDAYPKIVALIEKAISSFDEKTFDALLVRYPSPLISLNSRGMEMNDKISKSMRKKDLDRPAKVEDIADIFTGWYSLVRGDDLKNEAIFNAWQAKVFPGFLAKAITRLQKDGLQDVSGVEQIFKEAVALSRQKFLKGQGAKSNQVRIVPIIAKRLTEDVGKRFEIERSRIDEELRGFKEEERKMSDFFQIGFFDDLLHLTEFMMSGVCTWFERHWQVSNRDHHFGTLAIKNSDGRILGTSQVQILKVEIVGRKNTKGAKKSKKGWRVLALPGLHMDAGNTSISRERGLRALLEYAQRTAESAGLQGAVVPVSGIIHAQDMPDHKIISEFVAKGWLQPTKLSQNVVHSINAGNGQRGYSYQEVYLVQIPSDGYVLSLEKSTPTAQQDIPQRPKITELKPANVFKNFATIGPANFSEESLALLKEKTEKVLESMPENVVEKIREVLSDKKKDLLFAYDPAFTKSYVSRSEDKIIIHLGKDILYAPEKIESLGLRLLISEVLAEVWFEDYEVLEAQSKTNENAYFKLELFKALLNHRVYLPLYHKLMKRNFWDASNYWDEKTSENKKTLLKKYREDLDGVTQGWTDILQWNVFLSVMNDEDPGFLALNYVHLLFEKGLVEDEQIFDLLNGLRDVSVSDRVSVAGIRNVLKEFLFDGTVELQLKKKVKKDSFNHFNDAEKMQDLKAALMNTEDMNALYISLQKLISALLPLSASEIQGETYRSIEDKFGEKFLKSKERGKLLEELIGEILVRRLGQNAFDAMKKHLSAQRGGEEVPYFEKLSQELDAGSNADEYKFLRSLREGEGPYQLSSEGEDDEQPSENYDWIRQLFRFNESSGSRMSALLDAQAKEFIAGIRSSSGRRISILSSDGHVVIDVPNVLYRNRDALVRKPFSIISKNKIRFQPSAPTSV